MKRVLTSILALALMGLSLCAQSFERTYISTDRDIYLAGDRVWCSAFCFDLSSGALSGQSAVAYLELVAGESLASTSKISLHGGRGSGYLDIPSTTPTGNYYLLAFTAENKNEDSYDFMQNARVISVFNTRSSEKNPGVSVSEVNVYKREQRLTSLDGIMGIKLPQSVVKGDTASISINSRSVLAATMSISVSRRSALNHPSHDNIKSFVRPSASALGYSSNVLSEFDGEVIYAEVAGPDRDKVLSQELATAYISTIGEKNDTYTAEVDKDGNLFFKTYNIYGRKDMVCEVDAEDEDVMAHIDLKSPFVLPQRVAAPHMEICAAMEQPVLSLEPSEREGEVLERREDIVLCDADRVVYNLDEYVRFNTVREVLVEIVTEARSKGRGDKVRIQIIPLDGAGGKVSKWKTSLVLLDGVPVFRHKKVMDFDALKLSRVEVWRRAFRFGNKVYSGMVNFVTKDGGIEFIDFGNNVRIVDFQGACYPMSLPSPKRGETALWIPDLRIEAGESADVRLIAPQKRGVYEITVEGVTSDGAPFHEYSVFEVK